MANPAYIPTDSELQAGQYAKKSAERDQERIAEALADGDIPLGVYRLQAKIERQREALFRLQRRVVNQRFVLNLIHELGRELSAEEWAEHRSKLDPAKRDEIAEDMKFLGW